MNPLALAADYKVLIEDISRQVGEDVPTVLAIDTLNRSLAGSESSDEDMGAYIKAADAMLLPTLKEGMMADVASRIGWGVVLSGDATDLDDWKAALKLPFDPWVTETKEGLILRSKQLEVATTAGEAYDLALRLMDWANGALAVSHEARTVRLEAIAEVLSDGSCRRHVFMQVSGAEVRLKAGMVVVGMAGQ